MRTMRGTRFGLIAVGLALVAGCSEKHEAPEVKDAPAANTVEPLPVETPEPAAAPVSQAPVEKPPEPEQNAADALPPEEPLAPDAQTLEDADATGLTARSAAPPDVMSEPSPDPVGGLPTGGADGGP